MDHLNHKALTHGQNNVWYEYNDSEDVIVFVHGFFSESAGTWLYEDKVDPSNNQFWPDLIRQDARLGSPSQFLGGYHTALNSGNYGFEQCADELFRAMQRTDEFMHAPVMSKKSIIFVCHSMGGIIARYLLERYSEAFVEKRIGLVLIASPSYGSVHADRLAWLAELYNQKQGLHLKWGDALLKDLDSRFKDLVDSRKIPNLLGIEACENRFILHKKWLPDRNIVVTEESAGRYFGAPKMLRNTDHFSAVKPESVRHPAHELFVDFWQRYNSENMNDNSENINEVKNGASIKLGDSVESQSFASSQHNFHNVSMGAKEPSVPFVDSVVTGDPLGKTPPIANYAFMIDNILLMLKDHKDYNHDAAAVAAKVLLSQMCSTIKMLRTGDDNLNPAGADEINATLWIAVNSKDELHTLRSLRDQIQFVDPRDYPANYTDTLILTFAANPNLCLELGFCLPVHNEAIKRLPGEVTAFKQGRPYAIADVTNNDEIEAICSKSKFTAPIKAAVKNHFQKRTSYRSVCSIPLKYTTQADIYIIGVVNLHSMVPGFFGKYGEVNTELVAYILPLCTTLAYIVKVWAEREIESFYR